MPLSKMNTCPRICLIDGSDEAGWEGASGSLALGLLRILHGNAGDMCFGKGCTVGGVPAFPLSYRRYLYDNG